MRFISFGPQLYLMAFLVFILEEKIIKVFGQTFNKKNKYILLGAIETLILEAKK